MEFVCISFDEFGQSWDSFLSFFTTFSGFKIVVYIGNITNWDLNQLPHNSHFDVLPTMLKTGCS